MAFRFVRGAGNSVEPAVINMRCSGVISPGGVVELLRTAGAGVSPASSSTTTTTIFGIGLDYVQGASDVETRVIPFVPGQIWEGDCANAATTAQIGLRHALSALTANRGLYIHNTGTDLGAGDAHTAIFHALAMVGSTSGSGKLLGIFRTQQAPTPVNSTVFL